MVIGLALIILAVLVMPLVSKLIERNLELFLFVMGLCATLVSRVWIVKHNFNTGLFIKIIKSPLSITCAVFIAGLFFTVFQYHIRKIIEKILKVISMKLFFFFMIIILGLASGLITAIISALILVEIVNTLNLERKQEISLVIIACFSIGFGAVLTPVGEPLATIAISKLGKDFWYLFRLLGIYIIPGIVTMAGFAYYHIKPQRKPTSFVDENECANFKEIFIRALKVYIFVMALEMLSEGFKPVINMYIIGLNSKTLFWLNMISAILDNATLTAAEISKMMTTTQIKSILLGLLISGGMLIPGNIPNIISAGKLKIKSREWAKLGVPLGLCIMSIYFVILCL